MRYHESIVATQGRAKYITEDRLRRMMALWADVSPLGDLIDDRGSAHWRPNTFTFDDALRIASCEMPGFDTAESEATARYLLHRGPKEMAEWLSSNRSLGAEAARPVLSFAMHALKGAVSQANVGTGTSVLALRRLNARGYFVLDSVELEAFAEFACHSGVLGPVAVLVGLQETPANLLARALGRFSGISSLVVQILRHRNATASLDRAAFRLEAATGDAVLAIARARRWTTDPHLEYLINEQASLDPKVMSAMCVAATGATFDRWWARLMKLTPVTRVPMVLAVLRDPEFLARRDIPTAALTPLMTDDDAEVRAAALLALGATTDAVTPSPVSLPASRPARQPR